MSDAPEFHRGLEPWPADHNRPVFFTDFGQYGAVLGICLNVWDPVDFLHGNRSKEFFGWLDESLGALGLIRGSVVDYPTYLLEGHEVDFTYIGFTDVDGLFAGSPDLQGPTERLNAELTASAYDKEQMDKYLTDPVVAKQ